MGNEKKKSNPEKETLRKRYSEIVEKHPRENKLKLIDIILTFLRHANKNKTKEYFSIREIGKIMPNVDIRDIRHSINRLNEGKYLDLFRNGSSYVFFAAEKKDGSFIERVHLSQRQVINRLKNDNFDKIIKFYEQHENMLNESILIELERVRASRKLEHPNWTAYNILVQNAWNNGFDNFVKLSIRSAAKKYSAK